MADLDANAVALNLKNTLSPEANVRKQAEKFLESVEGKEKYNVLLLNIVDNASADGLIRVAAAIAFKNSVKRNWRIIPDEPNKISESDRETIKREIVDLMLRSPEKLQKQLSDAVSVIGREDFPDKWANLLPELVAKFGSGDFHLINGVLQTAHSLFKRYRHEFKSQELWTEIKLVLDGFAQHLTNLFEAIMEEANRCGGDLAKLKDILSSILLICKVFYSLNFQDLPEHFEENMEKWMKNFLILLTTDSKQLQLEETDETGPLDLIKSQVCDNVALYAQKYDEDFENYLPKFVEAIWQLLVSTEKLAKHDIVVSNAIGFLASASERNHYKYLFEKQETLKSICENVVVPNIEFREEDEEVFEDNPEEYIRRDIEGSDVDTRRRAASDLVRGLCKFHEQRVIEIFSHHVVAMLQQYQLDSEKNWKAKDAAIFLVTSLACKKQTAKHGTTQASELVNLQSFFTENILPELQIKNVDDHPVLKADSIKYVIIFRNMLSREVLVACLPLLVKHLTAKSHVVHSYSANCLEKLFTLKSPGGQGGLPKAEVQPFLEEMLSNLFNLLLVPGSQENEYVMKAIMRSFSLLQEAMLPYVAVLINNLASKLILVSKNPSKPQFNHYLFEAICCAIRVICKADASAVTGFETTLFPVIQEILSNDVTEFLPYVFQVLSLLLEIRQDIPEPYMKLFPLLLSPVLWERNGNIPPLVRLLQAYIEKGSKIIIESKKEMGLLGVFQKLIASKSNDHEGFYLLGSMVEHFEPSALSKHIQSVFILLFQRLQSSKTTKFVKGLLVFLCLYAAKYGGTALMEIIDTIQPGLFGNIVEKILIPDVQKVSGSTEKRICAVGMTKLLAECPKFLDTYSNLWVPLLQALIGLFELPEDDSIPDDEHFIEIEDTPGYQTAYSQLAFAGKKERDPFSGTIPDAKVFLAQSLQKLSAAHPGKIDAKIKSELHADALGFLQKYLQEAGITLG
ncbi:exportin-2-like isoform X2 [Oculina patagonica]